MEPPFETSQQLCWKLSPNKDDGSLLRSTSKRDVEKDWLPGDPRIRLRDPRITDLLYVEYAAPKLDQFSRYLWLVGRPDSTHIASLTHQLVRGRRIVVTDDPELHLIWINDRVFLKPLPEYMLSHAFWEYLFRTPSLTYSDKRQRDTLFQALSGFIRTYAFLIRHKSDFELAKSAEHRLINSKLRFSDLMRLLETIQSRVSDDRVSQRWQYGELRLSRLNFWSRILLKHHHFVKIHGQYGEYVAQFYAPLLFVFAVLSVILNAMQVGLSINRITAGDDYVRIMGGISKVFVPLSLLVVGVAVAWFVVTIATVLVRTVALGVRTQIRMRLRYRNDG